MSLRLYFYPRQDHDALSIHGGNSCNTLPEHVLLQGTIRILDKRCEEKLFARLEQACASIGMLYGVTCRSRVQKGYDMLENDPEVTARAASIIAAHFGKEAIHEPPAVMGGEDFSSYLEKVPGCYYRVGARKRKPDSSYYPSHHSRHEINDDALYYAIAASVLLAMES